jgi:hypothetical protein
MTQQEVDKLNLIRKAHDLVNDAYDQGFIAGGDEAIMREFDSAFEEGFKRAIKLVIQIAKDHDPAPGIIPFINEVTWAALQARRENAKAAEVAAARGITWAEMVEFYGDNFEVTPYRGETAKKPLKRKAPRRPFVTFTTLPEEPPGGAP